MSIEYLGEKVFLQESKDAAQVWVLRGTHKNIYAMELDKTGFSLPVWSSEEKAADFVKNARPIGQKYKPEAVPLGVFSQTWLSDQSMAIAELQINPDGKSTRVLVITKEEFWSIQA
ncbi:Protein of unknown function [Geoalkalibacter ferrihydriticus]|uniref:DUF2750 domain-containing protein n=2 Tax=Geoalkalibacter ferrihydriticus TaxID=392333 RepID=A0A0C2HZF8_9BACT|nr:DUF2750 domain-containing protein [Geoalkalibacter ferrihydriticus]KIH78102.1 hypothetical protein GFER_05855 [Geoalkalibacter ferrihydriticus DSM 17813]SDM78496.1 Protein of unknown function [Geoalkalibacter ferrihydriticus]